MIKSLEIQSDLLKMAEYEGTEKDNRSETEEQEEVSLVPFYPSMEVSKGLQAYRRGDAILYTVRGEPGKVQELMSELDGQGVKEVVALVTHRMDKEEIEEADVILSEDDEEERDTDSDQVS